MVAIPPALRLTAHGIRLTPRNFLELGQASGSSSAQMFVKIGLPFAMPSIMAGVNQCLMMAFGMVVIAGIVGSGGLGATIYDAVRTLDIGKSIDAAIAIVILTMILDRITEGRSKTSGRPDDVRPTVHLLARGSHRTRHRLAEHQSSSALRRDQHVVEAVLTAVQAVLTALPAGALSHSWRCLRLGWRTGG